MTTPMRCANSAMATYSTTKIVLMDTGNYPSYSNFLNESWTWASGVWTQSGGTLMDANGPLPGRINGVMSWDGTSVMLYGGQAGSATAGVLEDTWLYSGTSWTQQSGTMPFGRYKAGAAYLYGSGVIMFGGETTGNILEETWLWTQSTASWSQVSTGTTPPARTDHMMASKTTSAYVLMFGGKGTNSLFNDTWEYTAGDWSQLSVSNAPSVRSDACMSWDSTNSLFVMFGGTNGVSYLDETWTFTPSSGVWAQIGVPNGKGPAGRVGAQMAWDPTSNTTIMYGGISAADNYPSNHTWSFNGSTLSWSQK